MEYRMNRIRLVASVAVLSVLFGGLTAMPSPAMASGTHDHSEAESDAGYEHAHGHDHDADAERIYRGEFEDAEVRDRPLSDWGGDWQSVYSLLQDGTLDPVMAHKAETGEMTADQYKTYYETGYRTDVDRIEIGQDSVTFHRGEASVSARYESDGYEILTYEAGNRGVRFIFEKTEGDADAPQFIQFSDHRIAPSASDHYHLYWGNDREALLSEVTNWPTYYPAALSADAIVAEMIAH
jgi:zinc transport system substrate-binding protein